MKWNFPVSNTRQIQGINESGMEYFVGDPMKSLAREICQNSLDASIKDGVSVKVEFKAFKMDQKDIPDSEGLLEIFSKGENFWSSMNDKKAEDFYKKGIQILSSNMINCLRISDYNTKGLQGSREEYKTPWSNLTRSSGVSDKSGSSGGSFGIGKFAPFACSDLRTVFYSTRDINKESAFQGISRLTSLNISDDDLAAGIGYYSGEKGLPQFSYNSIDRDFKRDEEKTGTDIFIVGFLDRENWEREMLSAILDGFLYAIYSSLLTVVLGDLEINKLSLDTIIKKHKDNLTKNTLDTYSTLVSRDTKWFEVNFRNLGTIRLGLLIEENLDRKVAMIRKTGMKIKDQSGFSSVISFAGVLIIEGEEINSFLRSIENPQHTQWEVERHKNKRHAKSVLSEMNKYIKKMFDSLKDDEQSETIDPKLGSMLLEEDSTNNDYVETLTSTIQSIEVKEVKLKKIAKGLFDDLEPGDSFGPAGDDSVASSFIREEDTPRKDIGGFGAVDNSDTKINPRREVRKAIKSERVLCINKLNGQYLVCFTADSEIRNATVVISLVAENGKYDAPIIKAYDENKESIRVSQNKIVDYDIKAEVETRIFLNLDFYDYCSMEVSIYGN